jgi:hypothetical protein
MRALVPALALLAACAAAPGPRHVRLRVLTVDERGRAERLDEIVRAPECPIRDGIRDDGLYTRYAFTLHEAGGGKWWTSF